MPNLVSLTRPSLPILSKTQTGIFLISGLSQIRIIGDVHIKFGPVSKLDKIAKQRQKNLTMTNFDVGKFRDHCCFSNFWPIWSNLEAVFQTLEAVFKSVKFIFSLKVIFYLTKTEKRTKKYLTHKLCKV